MSHHTRPGPGFKPEALGIAQESTPEDKAAPWRQLAPALAAWANENLVNRRDCHGHYLALDRRATDRTAFTDKHKLTLATLQKHFEGRDQGNLIGLHSTARDPATAEGEVPACWCRWVGVDIDRHDEATDPAATLKAALALFDRAAALGFRPLLLDSNGRGGYHLLILFEGPIPSEAAHAFSRWLVRDWAALGLQADPETFPKQARINGEFGNWLRLPGRHHTRDHFTRVWGGSEWLEGSAAIKRIIGTKGSPAGLIPAEALEPPRPKTKTPRREPKPEDYGKDATLAALALDKLDPGMSRPEWIRVGMALTQLGREGLDLWDRWSAGSGDKYREGDCDRQWRSFTRDGIALGTLFHMAKARGFEFTRQDHRPPPPRKVPSGPAIGSNGRQAGHGGPPLNGATPPAGPGGGRPTIVISVQEHDVNDEAVASLGRDDNLYRRGNMLTTIVRTEPTGKQTSITRPDGSPRIAVVGQATLREKMSRAAQWLTPRGDDAHPPLWSVQAVAARGDWPGVRPLEAIVEAPTLRPDGSILEAPGWDHETGLFYEPNAAFPAVPEAPSREDARYAADEILELVCDFPFAGPAHRAAWLAGLLTPLARFAIDGPCPILVVDANSPGTGKSKLMDLIALVSTGRTMPRTSCPEEDDEMRKRITSVALSGDRLMLIDNISVRFGGPSLDAALTGTTWKDRLLGRSEMTPEIPLVTFWCATGNNIEYRGDILRRVLACRLVTERESPEERMDFAIPGDLLAHAQAHRPRLVVAALTILRAYIVAERPDPRLTPMDYPAWAGLVRHAVHWATGDDPAETRAELKAADPETNLRLALIRGWAELPGAREKHGLTTSDALKLLADEGRVDLYTTLRDALMEFSTTRDLPSAKSIGVRLKAIKDRVIGGLVLRATTYQGTKRWRVEAAQGGGSDGFGGSGGSGGSSPPPSRKRARDPEEDKEGETYMEMEGNHSHHSHHSHQNDVSSRDLHETDPEEVHQTTQTPKRFLDDSVSLAEVRRSVEGMNGPPRPRRPRRPPRPKGRTAPP